MKTQRVLFVILLLIVLNVNAGFWVTLPSADAGSSSCGSWTTDSFSWDDEDDHWYASNTNAWSGAIPRGNYDSNIKQYFCTGSVDSMPLGSYCFYQNRQNCNFY